MVRSEISHTLDSAFHMLWHFEDIPASVEEQLFAKGYSRAVIEESFHTPRSRFGFQFANSIDQLSDKLFSDCTYSVKKGLNGNLLVHAVVSTDKFPTGVGTCGVVSVEPLDESQRTKIYRKHNRGIQLWYLYVHELPMTVEFTLILKPATQHNIFVTAFPGPPAMPLPNNKMPHEIYKACLRFWNDHIFLNLNKKLSL